MFDPYHRWLAIPPDQRPPTFYQLLGIAPTETDTEVIKEAALRQAGHVRTYQTGPHAQMCTTLLNEIGQARATLVNPGKRREYDDRLTRQVPVSAPPPIPGAKPPPLPVAPAPGRDVDIAFDALAADAESPRRLDPPGRYRRTRTSLWKEPAAYLYLCLLGAGVGLGFWVGHAAHPPAEVGPDTPEAAPQPPCGPDPVRTPTGVSP
jgi:hypothetical protein